MVDHDTESLEELAHRHGYDSFAALFSASTSLLQHGGARWYIAHDPRGQWFVWNDRGRSLTGDRPRDKA